MKLFPKWKGELVDEILRESQDICIHSKFKNGFNLSVSDKLLFIGTDQKGIVPFGIHFSSVDYKNLISKIDFNEGVAISYSNGNLLLEDIELNITATRKFDCTILTSQHFKLYSIAQIEKNINILRTFMVNTGLDFQQEMKMDDSRMNFINSTSKNQTKIFLKHFLGRGLGLTPSGDDFLIGLMSVHLQAAFLPDCFFSELINFLQEDCTTDVSKSYLLAAAQGKFSSLVRDVINSLYLKDDLKLYTSLAKLENSGSTSGRDTIAGMHAALTYLFKKEKDRMKKRVVLALGGNAILQPGQEGTYENQKENIETSCDSIAKIINNGHELVIVHGNGPQVGQILRQNELAKEEVPQLPLPVCSSESQGFIGYMMQESLKNRLPEKDVATVLTMTEVDENDQAFQNPTKPIGSFYTEEEAKELEASKGWTMGEDAGRGYRRLVPSPKPKAIVEVNTIKKMLGQDIVVVSTGGGGIPVKRDEKNNLAGVAAVIDKDLSALRLSTDVDADVLMILTDVPNVYVNYGKPNQEKLEEITIDTAKKYYDEGHFSDGSMGPKMEACIEFASLGKTAIICALSDAVEALAGNAGTRIVG